ncbi:MAG: class I SAM-dependent methyltransferase [Dehalococcoidia bacterium]
MARQIAGFWREMGSPAAFTVFEAAAGSGRLCADVLAYLRDQEPDFYRLLRYVQQDPSLRGDDARQRLLDAGVPEDKIEVAAALPSGESIQGCIISNELLDALPFDRVRMRDGRLYELRVGLDRGGFVDIETAASPELRDYFAALGLSGPGEGCEAEVCLGAAPWITHAASALSHGYLVTLDYGYEASELFSSWRRRGTLLTFYRQTSGDDPYARIGLQDITASVDFTTVRRAGEAAGLKTVAQASQAEYLAALGIGDALAQPPAADRLEAYYALRRAAIELTDMAGLGRIRVLLQSKGLE